MKDEEFSNEKLIENLLFKTDEEIIDENLYENNKHDKNFYKRKKQILIAAVKVFSEKGFQGSRTSEIAKEAKVSEGTIFNYYKCKKDLLIGILIETIVNVVNPIVILSYKKGFEDKESIERSMHRLIIDRLVLLRENYQLIKTILVEAMYHRELYELLNKELYPKLITLIDSYVENNIDEGNFRNIDKSIISRSIISSIIGYVFLSNTLPESFGGKSDEEEVKKIVDVILYGIINKKE